MEPVTFRFATAARRLGQASRRLGLQPPAFRSPPRRSGMARTLRRRSDGGAVVAVVLRNRPWAAVAADLVEGVVVANRLHGTAADQARTVLWAAISDPDSLAA